MWGGRPNVKQKIRRSGHILCLTKAEPLAVDDSRCGAEILLQRNNLSGGGLKQPEPTAFGARNGRNDAQSAPVQLFRKTARPQQSAQPVCNRGVTVKFCRYEFSDIKAGTHAKQRLHKIFDLSFALHHRRGAIRSGPSSQMRELRDNLEIRRTQILEYEQRRAFHLLEHSALIVTESGSAAASTRAAIFTPSPR